mmetsp:Transcript_30612/g.49822  ORF Transcript_30612/g.49822 Transcript_30612/m.49822 type:complete len:101 (-) Transcript_30612:471-773(-)
MMPGVAGSLPRICSQHQLPGVAGPLPRTCLQPLHRRQRWLAKWAASESRQKTPQLEQRLGALAAASPSAVTMEGARAQRRQPLAPRASEAKASPAQLAAP